jgi:hypothetical protein
MKEMKLISSQVLFQPNFLAALVMSPTMEIVVSVLLLMKLLSTI